MPTYPYVSPTAAASGMTQGIENGATSGTITMMQVRAAAHDAQREAAAAAMAKSAEAAIEEEQHRAALENARQVRLNKMEASERLKWERASAYNAYNGVSQGEISSWKDQQGNVKVGRGLPPEFAAAMREQDAADAAAAEAARKKGLNPLQKIGEKVSSAISPDDAPVETGLSGPKPLPREIPASASLSPEIPRERPKILNFTPPKIRPPKLFSHKDDSSSSDLPQFMGAGASASQAPSAAPAAAPAPAPVQPMASVSSVAPPPPAPNEPAPSKRIPARSGASLLQSPVAVPEAPEEKEKLFAFGRRSKKENAPPASALSSGLFPVTAPSPVELPPSASQRPATAEFSLPQAGSANNLKKFSLPAPKFGGSTGGGAVPQQADSYYTVTSSAQFMKRSADQSSTIITALPPGTVVKMTRPGSDWAGIQLPDGTTGTVEAKYLRAAAGSESALFNR